MKRPIVIEFSGLPNSGKTTLLHNLDAICKQNHTNALIMREPAEMLPDVILKGSLEQNLWITLETLQKSIEISFQSDFDYILLDRGFYNQIFWSTMYEEKDENYSEFVSNFMEKMSDMFKIKPDYLYIIDVDIEESLKRRMNNGEPVTFSKREFLINYRKKFEEFSKTIKNKFYIDTSNLTERQVAAEVYKTIRILQG